MKRWLPGALAGVATLALAAGCTADARPTTRPEPHARRTTDPTASLSPRPEAGFPWADNTGVPAGVALSVYRGPMTITQSGTVIDAKRIWGTLVIAADDVTIKRSIVKGNVAADSAGVHVTIIDSEVDGGTSSAPAIGYSDITMSRVNVHGARVSVLCGADCRIENSWLHDQYLKPGSDWHVNGYVSNGGSNVVVRHNTIACEPENNANGGGCTGPASSLGDFAPLANITYDRNFFVAGPGSYCLRAGYDPAKPYGSDPTGIVVTNNVFQRGPSGKCGTQAPVTSFLASGAGNVWRGNRWDDGKPVPPA